jgi:hypothetical protein
MRLWFCSGRNHTISRADSAGADRMRGLNDPWKVDLEQNGGRARTAVLVRVG